MESAKGKLETVFNHAAPLYYSMILYLAAALLGCFAWLGWTKTLRRASIWLCLFTLLAHTLALVARMYISGRPPVTTLYTSTLFVGWACVLMGLAFEMFSRIGIANVVASTTGFLALLIGYQLTTNVASFQGDTFTVLVAVLDTNFWLATHVTCITAGYAATLLAGLLGIMFIIAGRAHTVADSAIRKIGRADDLRDDLLCASSSASSARCSAVCGPTIRGAASGAGIRKKTVR